MGARAREAGAAPEGSRPARASERTSASARAAATSASAAPASRAWVAAAAAASVPVAFALPLGRAASAAAAAEVGSGRPAAAASSCVKVVREAVRVGKGREGERKKKHSSLVSHLQPRRLSRP